jgi:hypothetical protein
LSGVGVDPVEPDWEEICPGREVTVLSPPAWIVSSDVSGVEKEISPRIPSLQLTLISSTARIIRVNRPGYFLIFLPLKMEILKDGIYF